MTDKTLAQEILEKLTTLCRLQPKHDLIAYYEAAHNPAISSTALAEAFCQRFNPDKSRAPEQVLQSYCIALDEAITKFHLAIDEQTAQQANEWLDSIVARHRA